MTSASFPTIHIWTFGNNDRLVVNKYAFSTANDYDIRDCINWDIFGSNDGSQWDLLDSQTGITWTARFQTKTFEMSNQLAYNKYKWQCNAVKSLSGAYGNVIQMSEWNLLFTGAAYVPPGISYPQDIYTWSVGVDNVNITPGKSGCFSSCWSEFR